MKIENRFGGRHLYERKGMITIENELSEITHNGEA